MSTNAHCALGETCTPMSNKASHLVASSHPRMPAKLPTGGRRQQTTRTGRLALRADNKKKNGRGNAATLSVTTMAFQGGETDALREFAKTTNSNGNSSMRASSGSDCCGTGGRSLTEFAQPNRQKPTGGENPKHSSLRTKGHQKIKRVDLTL